MKLRTHLFLLTLVTVVPMALFAAGLAAYHAQSQRESVERGMRDTARALVLAIDRDIRDVKTGVQTLAGSAFLDDPTDLRRFYEEAASVSKSFGGWAVLSDPSGRQVLNTSRSFGTVLPMPTSRSLAMMQGVAESRLPFVSNVFIGTVSRQPAVIVAVPVVRSGAVRYILDFSIEPRQFTSLLQETRLSPEWIAVITDRDGGVVARAPEAEAFVGRKAPRAWIERTSHVDEGLIHGGLLSASPVYAAFTRSTESGWIVGVAVPTRLVEASFRRSLLLISAGGVLVLAVGGALAFMLGKRIAAPIAALAASLQTRSAPGPAARSTVTEIEELRQALEDAIAGRHLLATEQAARAVAEQRAAREEFANRAKDDFLAVLSHELRTPLNSMLGWVRLLRGGHLDAARSAHALDVIERNVGQQSRLISDLLDVSRIIAGRFELTLQPVDLPALVAGVMDTVRPTAEAKEITLTTRLDPDAGPVQGDPERLRQVVENLVGNAVKFTPRGGHVMVQLVREDQARLVVSDNGKGIAPDFLPHIFERFRQADSTSTRAHAGLGLGLAIVRHLVELQGGRVAAQSEGEGRGATFTVTLPLMAATLDVGTAGEPTPRRADDAQRLDGVKVLVVDDDPDTRNLIATVLAEHGAVPTTVADAREGLAATQRLVPDVMVCDIAMPGDDGYALIGQVRSWAKTAGIPVAALALTAYARREDRDRAIAAGFDLHLAKPVEPADLVAAIGRLAAPSTSRSETT